MRAKRLTKAQLMSEFNVTDVTANGDVYVNGRIKAQQKIMGPQIHSEKMVYLGVNLASNDELEYYKHASTGNIYSRKKERLYMVHRIVYAWYHGVAEEGLEIDHLDNNPFNNSIDNLEQVTKQENLRRKKSTANQYSCIYPIELVEEYRDVKNELRAKADYYKDQVDGYKAELAKLKEEWHDEEDPYIRESLRMTMLKYKQLISDNKELWHQYATKYRDCKIETFMQKEDK